MDMLLVASADALAERERTADHTSMTPAEEDCYYARHTLNVIVPTWMLSLVALLRQGHRSLPDRIRATRHA